jgi:hypothetical protein
MRFLAIFGFSLSGNAMVAHPSPAIKPCGPQRESSNDGIWNRALCTFWKQQGTGPFGKFPNCGEHAGGNKEVLNSHHNLK